MTGLSIILALRAALSPSVLWQNLRCGLPTDMILQKRPTRFAKTNNQKIFLLGHKNLSVITAVNKTFVKVQTKKYHTVVPNNITTTIPNTADITHMHPINSTTFLKKSIF
jgi:hypothetical protein